MDINVILTNYEEDENGCWNWKGNTTGSRGYGQARFNGKHYYVHRLVAEVYIKEMQPHNIIHHTCNNPRCINPDHIEICESQSEHLGRYKAQHNKSGRPKV